MARKLYRLRYGMKQHPETFAERGYPALKTGEVYPGDVFEVEENLILRDPTMGGWVDRKADGTAKLEVAEPVADATEESWTVHDEPSRIAGYNISAAQLAKLEREEEEGSSVTAPVPSVAAAAPASVKPAGRATAAR